MTTAGQPTGYFNQTYAVEFTVEGNLDGTTLSPPLDDTPPSGEPSTDPQQLVRRTVDALGLIDVDYLVPADPDDRRGARGNRQVAWFWIEGSSAGAADAAVEIVDAIDPTNVKVQKSIGTFVGRTEFFDDVGILLPQGSMIRVDGMTGSVGAPIKVRLHIQFINNARDMAAVQKAINCALTGDLCANTIIVRSLADLAAPVADVIQLPDSTLVMPCGMIDLQGSVLAFGDGTVIRGGVGTLDGFQTDNAALALIQSTETVVISDVTLMNTGGAIFDHDGGDVDNFIVINSFLSGSVSMGTVKSAPMVALQNVFMSGNSDGFTIDETIGALNVLTTIAQANLGSFTAFTIPATASVGVLEFTDNVFFLTAIQTGFDFAAGATYGTGVLLANLFPTGLGAPLTGVTKADPRFVVKNNVGILDSVTLGNAAFTGNLGGSPTVISVTGTFVTIGTGTPAHPLFVANPVNERFSLSGATTAVQILTYDGLVADQICIRAAISVQDLGAGGDGVAIRLLQNGVPIPNTTLEGETGGVPSSAGSIYTEGVVTAAPGDTFQIEIANLTSTTNIIVSSCTFTAGGT